MSPAGTSDPSRPASPGREPGNDISAAAGAQGTPAPGGAQGSAPGGGPGSASGGGPATASGGAPGSAPSGGSAGSGSARSGPGSAPSGTSAARGEVYRPAKADPYEPARADTARPVIAVDAMGGDFAPSAIVAGVVAAWRDWGVRAVLVGRPGQIRPLLAKHGAVGEIRLIAAEDSVSMAEGAMSSWRRPRSSIAVACQLVRLGQTTAVVSAGSTAAIVSIAQLRLRNLSGVLRPGLAVALPTSGPNPTLLIDAGAVADPKPEMLAQFAQLGSAYAEVRFGITKPRVGLLSIGAEPGKGNKLTKRAYELLSAESQHGAASINFMGNVEGGDLLTGAVDVVVTEGFTGNVTLKTLEGTARFTADQFKSALGGSRAARIGALLQRKELRDLSARLDPETYGGAALLGLEGIVVIAHGVSTERGVAAACRLAADLARGKTTERIKERLGPQRQSHFLRRS